MGITIIKKLVIKNSMKIFFEAKVIFNLSGSKVTFGRVSTRLNLLGSCLGIGVESYSQVKY